MNIKANTPITADKLLAEAGVLSNADVASWRYALGAEYALRNLPLNGPLEECSEEFQMGYADYSND